MPKNKTENESMLADLGNSSLGTMGDAIEQSLRRVSRKKKENSELRDIAEVANIGIEETLKRRGSSANLKWRY